MYEYLLKLVNKDLDRLDDEQPERMQILAPHPEVGVVAPLNWLDPYPEAQEPWGKFMEGRSFVPSGYYLTDVRQFLASKIRSKP
jgi:hypothetical protein